METPVLARAPAPLCPAAQLVSEDFAASALYKPTHRFHNSCSVPGTCLPYGRFASLIKMPYLTCTRPSLTPHTASVTSVEDSLPPPCLSHCLSFLPCVVSFLFWSFLFCFPFWSCHLSFFFFIPNSVFLSFILVCRTFFLLCIHSFFSSLLHFSTFLLFLLSCLP